MKKLHYLICVILIACCVSNNAIAADNQQNINIAEQATSTALLELAEKTNVQIIFSPDLVGNTNSPSISGEFSVEQALTALLEKTNLSFIKQSDSTYLIKSKESAGKKPLDEDKLDENEALDIVVVTGSQLITEPSKLTRQVDIFSAEQMREMGAHDLSTFFQLLPQNVASATNVGVGAGNNSFGSVQNLYGGSGVNLRGIGDGTTLVLVDGRRAAKGGVFGEAVDINSFPLYTIERIEIIYDGASAIYGSDAIGGVVNIITKKDYEGTAFDINTSYPSQGGTSRTQVDLAHTFNWDNSSLTLGVSTQFETALDGAERNISFGTQFPPLPFGSPGNIRSGSTVFDSNTFEEVTLPLFYIDPVTGDRIDTQVNEEVCFPDGAGGEFCFISSTWIADLGVDVSALTAIFNAQLPEGYTGGGLTLADINDFEPTASGLRDERDLTLIPKNESFNYRMNYEYDFLNDTSFQFNLSYYQNKSSYSFSNGDNSFLVSPNHPFSPFSVSVFQHLSADFLPTEQRDTKNNTLHISTFLEGDFSENWAWELNFSLSKNSYESFQKNSRNLDAYDALAGADFLTPDGLIPTPFDPFAPLFGLSSEQAFIETFTIPELLTTTDTQESGLDFKARGVLFETSAGPATTLIGLGLSNEKLTIYDESATPNSLRVSPAEFVGGVYYDENISRSPHFFNTEIYIPFVSEKNAISGIQQLALTGAYRYDDYEAFSGDSWAMGILYSPTTWLDIVANVSESYKAPNLADSALPQAFSTNGALFVYAEDRETIVDLLFNVGGITGGNKDLVREIGKSHSVGIRLTPESMPAFTAEVNYSENEFIDQIGSLASLIGNTTFADLAAIQSGEDINPALYFEDGLFVQNGLLFNVSDQLIRNLDAKASYLFYTGNAGSMRFGLAYNRTLENSIRAASTSVCSACEFLNLSDEFIDRVGFINKLDDPFIGNIVFPEHRGTINLGWDYKGFSINAVYQYQSKTRRFERIAFGDDVIDTIVTTHPVRPVNLQFSYDFGASTSSWIDLDSAKIILNISNVLNDQFEISRTPEVPNTPQGRLDSRASNPFGRVYSLRFQMAF